MAQLINIKSDVLAVGTIDSTTPSSDGAVDSNGALILQSASATVPGLVNITTQTFAGNKTFTGTITASGLSGSNTGDVTLTAVGSSANANGASLSGQALTLQPATASFPGVLIAADWTTFNAKVDGAGTVTDTALVRFSGTAGKTIQNSAVTADSNGSLSLNQSTGSGQYFPLYINNGAGVYPTIKWNASSGGAGLVFQNGATLRAQLTDAGNFSATKFDTIGGFSVQDDHIQRQSAGRINFGNVANASEPAIRLLNENTNVANVINVQIDPAITTSVALVVKGIAAQSANLQDWRDSTGAVLASVTAAGNISGANLSGTNTGNVTLATVGSTPAAAGASLSGQVLTLQPADGTNAGVVSTTTQTFAGVKTLTSPVLVTPALGTPASGVLTNTTGLPISSGVSGLGSNVATFLATPSSANLAAALTDETGTGAAVFAGSPTFTGTAVFSGLTLATAGGTPATLNAYETHTYTSTFTFNNAGGTTGTLTMKITMIGDSVTLDIPIALATTAATSTSLAANTAMASRFRPSATMVFYSGIGKSAGSNLIVPILIVLGTDGIITFYRDGTTTTIWDATATGNSGLTNTWGGSYKI